MLSSTDGIKEKLRHVRNLQVKMAEGRKVGSDSGQAVHVKDILGHLIGMVEELDERTEDLNVRVSKLESLKVRRI